MKKTQAFIPAGRRPPCLLAAPPVVLIRNILLIYPAAFTAACHPGSSRTSSRSSRMRREPVRFLRVAGWKGGIIAPHPTQDPELGFITSYWGSKGVGGALGLEVIPRVRSQPAGAAEKPVETCYKAGKAAEERSQEQGNIFSPSVCLLNGFRAARLTSVPFDRRVDISVLLLFSETGKKPQQAPPGGSPAAPMPQDIRESTPAMLSGRKTTP